MQTTIAQPHKLPDPADLLEQFWAQKYGVPTLPDTATLNKMLDRAKGRLFFKKRAGFLGSLLCRHKIVWDKTCSTAWCNGTTIGWNPYFFVACTLEGRVFVLGHEIWHSGYDHMGRLGKRDPGDWNTAADHRINLDMKNDGFKMGPEDIAGIEVHCDPVYGDMTTEAIYEIVHEENEQSKGDCDDDQGEGEGGSTPSSGDPFADAAGDPTQQEDMGGDLRKPEAKDIERMQNIVRASQAEQQSLNPGKLPGEVTTTIDKFLNPVLPWTSILRNHLTLLSKDDSSWRKPSRRSEEFYLPSKIGFNGLEHGLFATDVSGSIRDRDMLRSNSEAKGIYDEFSPERLTLVTFDTQIQNIKDLHAGEAFDSMTITGRGGTDLNCVYDYAKENPPSVIVIFTDLYVEIPRDPGIPVIWIAIGHDGEVPEHLRPPYGKLIAMPPEED